MPTPGARNIPLAATRSSAGSTRVGPTTAPIGPSLAWRQAGVQLPYGDQQVLFDAATAESGGGLDRTAFGVGRVGHHEQAASRFVGARDKGAHRSQAQIWMHGQSVGSEGGISPQIGFGVGVVGGSDVAPFGINNDQQTCALGFADQALERPEALPTVSLVESRLELDQANRPAGCFQGDLSEAVETLWGVPQAPSVENRAGRIETPGERPIS